MTMFLFFKCPSLDQIGSQISSIFRFFLFKDPFHLANIKSQGESESIEVDYITSAHLLLTTCC